MQGDDAVLPVPDVLLALAVHHQLREVAYDPWRFQSEALRLERDHGLLMVQFPQSHARMTIASEGLHKAIVERKLRHRDHRALDAHVAAAAAKQTGRGWRLVQGANAAQIYAAIALAMACERAQVERPVSQLLGWL
jgi:phage terminase large subunit-like protein